jgi:hypothetical protein
MAYPDGIDTKNNGELLPLIEKSNTEDKAIAPKKTWNTKL